MRWRGDEADAPIGREDFGEAAHIDRALQAIERTHAGSVREVGRGDVAVGVVFHDVEVVLRSELHDAMRAGRREASACGVVQHAHADVELRAMLFAVARHDCQVRAVC